MASLLLAVIYLAFISLGLPDSLLGSAWPVMRQEFDVALSSAGLVSMIISGGTIFSSLMSERLTKRCRAGVLTVASVFLTAVSMFGFSISSRFYMLCLWAVPYGLGAGAIDATLNNYVALHYSSRHMNWLHCFWGVGTVISPYVMSYALSHGLWNDGYRIVSAVQLVITAVLLASLPVWRINRKIDEQVQRSTVLGLRGALKIKGVSTLLAGFFAYCSAEATTMLWASSYLVDVCGVTKETAAAFGSLFFMGMTVGRFLSGFISDKIGDKHMINAGLLLALFGVVLIALPIQTAMTGLIGFVVIGLGCAPVYPCIIHMTPDNFGAENSQGIIGIQMASAYLGSTLMPPLFGLLGQWLSLKLLSLYLAIFLCLCFIMIYLTNQLVRSSSD